MNQKGFTLIEIIVAMAVGGMIMAATVSGIFQVVFGVGDIRAKTVALNDLENAAHWITRDVVMGINTNLVDGEPSVDQTTITWSDYTKAAELEESVSHTVSYTYSGTELQRNYDGVVTVVGRRLSNVDFSLSGSFITVILTAYIDDESGSTITRTYRLLMRGDTGL